MSAKIQQFYQKCSINLPKIGYSPSKSDSPVHPGKKHSHALWPSDSWWKCDAACSAAETWLESCSMMFQNIDKLSFKRCPSREKSGFFTTSAQLEHAFSTNLSYGDLHPMHSLYNKY